MKPYNGITSRMARICQAISLPVIIVSFAYACNSPAADSQILLVDSLLQVTIDLQDRISSPDIQRLDDFYKDIEKDLEYFRGLSSRIPVGKLNLLNDYQILDNQLGGCLRSCGKFHEELFMVETSLREVRSLLEKKQVNPSEIEDRIAAETSLLEELNDRIDNALSLISVHLLHYYELKPIIDSVIASQNNAIGINE